MTMTAQVKEKIIIFIVVISSRNWSKWLFWVFTPQFWGISLISALISLIWNTILFIFMSIFVWLFEIDFHTRMNQLLDLDNILMKERIFNVKINNFKVTKLLCKRTLLKSEDFYSKINTKIYCLTEYLIVQLIKRISLGLKFYWIFTCFLKYFIEKYYQSWTIIYFTNM